MRTPALLTIALLSAVLACVGGMSPPTMGGDTTVRIRDMQFQPSTVKIKVGQSVTWSNSDDRDHTIDATNGSFKSGNLKSGSSYTYRFNAAGTFEYACSYHPRMRGTITVEN